MITPNNKNWTNFLYSLADHWPWLWNSLYEKEVAQNLSEVEKLNKIPGRTRGPQSGTDIVYSNEAWTYYQKRGQKR